MSHSKTARTPHADYTKQFLLANHTFKDEFMAFQIKTLG